MTRITPFLMYQDQLDEALALYTRIFPDTEVLERQQSGPDGPLVAARFRIGDQHVMAYNGGPHFQFSDAFSFFVDCKDQAEVDRYWDALLATGATPQQCGWIMDPYGVRWQIVPRRFMELVADPDPAKSKAVVDAMLQMVRLDVAALEKAHREA